MNADGLAIARQRIAEEAEARTGSLDLRRLGLSELPEELFALEHLRRLNLGDWLIDDKEYVEATADIAPNQLGRSLARLKELPRLRGLSCLGMHLDDLAPLATLTGLQSLYCSHTQVSELAPLATLTGLQSLYCSGCSLTDVPRQLLDLPLLDQLILYESRVPGIPAEVLSQSWSENCLKALRAHFRDLDRMTYSIHWQDRYRNIQGRLGNGHYDIFDTLGRRGADELYYMKEFYSVTGDILATIADIVQPRSFDELMTYGLDG